MASWQPLLEGGRTIRPVEAATWVLAALRPASRAPIEEALASATPYGREILAPIVKPS